MDYCLIEKWNSNCTLPEKCKAVALTEEAIFYLEHCGIQYITLEEFYASYEIRGNVDEFLMDQLSWFDDFDKLLKETFPDAKKLGINLATIYFYGIKRVVDNVILATRILRKFIESVNPDKIWYIGPRRSTEEFDDLLSSGCSQNHPFDSILDPDFKTGENPYSLLIAPLCKAYNISFQRLSLNIPINPKNETSMMKVSRTCIDTVRLRRMVIKHFPIDMFRSIYIYLKSMRTNLTKGSVLLLRNTGSMEAFCVDMRKSGFEIFIKGSAGIRKLSWQLWRKGMEVERTAQRTQDIREDIIDEIVNGDLMEWINRHAGLDVSSLLSSRFRHFFYKICPELLARIQDYIKFYNKNKINFVIAPNIWTIDEHAAVAAARLALSTKSIGIAHGSDVYECKSRFFFSNRHYDFLFSFSSADAEHERWLGKYFDYNYPKIYEFPYFQKRISKKSKQNRKIKSVSFSSKRRVVLFIPIIYGTPPGRSIQLNQPFPMEYVQWHRALLNFFAKRKDTFFIWKGLVQPEQQFDLMAELIKEKRHENVKFDTDKLSRWFPYVERVLLDIPSTAFFESIYSHMPVMSLYRPKYQILRKNAHDSFGSSMRAYNSIDDGLRLVEEFLDGQKEKYIVPFSESDAFLPETLITHLHKEMR